jgi:hypothetical protein
LLTHEETLAGTAQPNEESQNSGLIYAPSLDDAVRILADLSNAGDAAESRLAHDRTFEHTISSAVLEWLVGPISSPANTRAAILTSRRDVGEIVATSKSFDRLDREYGGDFSRQLAAKYLHDWVIPRLSRPVESSARSDLFLAAAVLCELIGYMAYDAEKHGMGQQYFVQALRLAKEAGNRAYGAFVLATISHQALYLDNPRQALRMIGAAKEGYRGSGVPTVLAELAMLEATAYSVLGDRNSCAVSLMEAERTFSQQVDEVPNWASHWDQAVFSSFIGDCWLNLGVPAEARPHLELVRDKSEHQVRRTVYTAGQLSRLHLLEGDIDEAAHYALTAAQSATGTKSKRSNKVVRELRKNLSKYSIDPSVRELDNQTVDLQEP